MNRITLLFTPPNHPELQPIELLWARTKKCVRDWFRWGRNQDDLISQARIAWYGNEIKDFLEVNGVLSAVQKTRNEACDGGDGFSTEYITPQFLYFFCCSLVR